MLLLQPIALPPERIPAAPDSLAQGGSRGPERSAQRRRGSCCHHCHRQPLPSGLWKIRQKILKYEESSYLLSDFHLPSHIPAALWCSRDSCWRLVPDMKRTECRIGSRLGRSRSCNRGSQHKKSEKKTLCLHIPLWKHFYLAAFQGSCLFRVNDGPSADSNLVAH